MYLPRSFRVQDPELLAAFMKRYSFCTLITPSGDSVEISHLPLVLDTRGEIWLLRGHFARVNDHWKALPDVNSTAIFHGPHSYISPGWYVETAEVPTWNYTTVHASGGVTLMDDPQRLGELVDEMISYYEPQYGSPWDRQLDAGYRERQLAHIVGFELGITELEAKFKLGQNRSAADQQSMHKHLLASGHTDSSVLGDFISSLTTRTGRPE